MIAVIVGVVVLGAGAVGYFLTRGSGSPAAAKPVASTTGKAAEPTTAAQWLSTALAAAKAKGAVHVDVLNKLKGRVGRYSDDDGPGVGVQRITIEPGMHAEVRVMPGVTYFTANRAALTGYFGFAPSVADKAAGRWLVLHPATPGYTQVTEGVTFSSTMKEMTLRGPLKLLAARTLQGVRVMGIRGTAAGPAMKHKAAAIATLWVTASGAHLPVLYTSSVPKFGSTTTMFSRWGMTVDVVAPTAA